MGRTEEFDKGQAHRPTGMEHVSDEVLHHTARQLTKHITHLVGKPVEELTAVRPRAGDRSPPIETLKIQNMLYDTVEREMKRRGHWS